MRAYSHVTTFNSNRLLTILNRNEIGSLHRPTSMKPPLYLHPLHTPSSDSPGTALLDPLHLEHGSISTSPAAWMASNVEPIRNEEARTQTFSSSAFSFSGRFANTILRITCSRVIASISLTPNRRSNPCNAYSVLGRQSCTK